MKKILLTEKEMVFLALLYFHDKSYQRKHWAYDLKWESEYKLLLDFNKLSSRNDVTLDKFNFRSADIRQNSFLKKIKTSRVWSNWSTHQKSGSGHQEFGAIWSTHQTVWS